MDVNDFQVIPETGTKKPAPGRLELVRGFVNTVDVEAGTERLVDPSALLRWLEDRNLIEPGATLGQKDLRNALDLREALRSMLAHNNGDPLDPHAVAALDRHATRARLTVRFKDGAVPRVEPEASGADGALGRLIAVVVGSTSEGTWDRLKICRSDTCQWAFYDWSKNHSGAWCTMTVCGNRAKVRTYRRRARDENRRARREARSSK